MLLLLTAVDQQGHVNTFSYELSHLDDGFNLLDTMAQKGYYLVRAQLIDEGKWTHLPVEAFDESPVFPVIQELEKGWRQILTESVDARTIFNWPDNDHRLNKIALPMTYCIVYFSTSFGLFREEDLVALLEQSRKHNYKASITGVLLYVQGNIVQVIEGDQEALESLFERIKQDRRHKGVTCVVNQRIQERLFPNWSMAYETLTVRQLAEVKSIIKLDQPIESTFFVEQPAILKTLRLFYETNRQL